MKFVPKEVQFSDNFEKLADKIQEGGTLFMELLDNYDHLDEKALKLKEIEHEADAITHAIYKDLHTTFITPLDREDIFALANSMDNVMDMIEESATKMQLYKIKKPVPHLRELTNILQKSIVHMKKAIYTMRHRGENVDLILSTCAAINLLENEADQMLRMAMTHLFEQEKNVIELIKCKEILEHIEEATDNCEDVSNIVEGIILKYG
jgi:predicted phosphate transport protein (TIGR00153 family)